MPLRHAEEAFMWMYGLIMSCFLSWCGCTWFIVEEESAQAGVVSDGQSDADGQHRAAIRARVAEAHQPSSLMTGASDTPTSEPGTRSWPPDWLASYFSPDRLSKDEKVELERATGPAPAPSALRGTLPPPVAPAARDWCSPDCTGRSPRASVPESAPTPRDSRPTTRRD